MKTKFKSMIALVLSVIMVFTLIGCSAPKGPVTESASSTDANQPVNEVPDISSADNGEGKITKDELIIAMPYDVSALDPMKCWQVAAYYFYWTVYERLIKYNVETCEYEPELAKSWELSDDGKVYTFHLQEGVKWHDGSDFTAKDVKYTIERGLELGTGNYPGVDHVEVVDDLTVKVYMVAPDSVFMDKQWTGDCCVLKEGSGDQLSLKPIGTGPFKFTEWVSGDHITIEAFDNYWREQSGTKKITFKIIPEASARLIALQTGDVDIAPLDATAINHATADENINLLSTTSISVNYIGFNCESEHFSNELVRQACCYAIDKDSIVLAELEGQGTALKSIVGQGKMGYYDGFDGYYYDVEKAKELMIEAGYENGFDAELTIRGNPITAQLIQANLSEIGINLIINQMEPAAMLDYVGNGNTDMFLVSRSGGSADSYLCMFYSSAFGPGGNRMFYKNDELDELLDQSHLAMDMNERNEIYKQIQEHINDYAPVFPLFAPTLFLGTNTNIKDVRADQEGCHDYRNVYYGE